MRNPELSLTHPSVSQAQLPAMARQTPCAWESLKIAALLLVLNGQRPGWIANVLGLTLMSLNRWVHRVNAGGVESLPPRPRRVRTPRLTPAVRKALEGDLEKAPREFGLNRTQWDGPTLVVHLRRRLGITLRVRQAQYCMHRFGYRQKRASYSYLQARAEGARWLRRQLKKLRSLKRNEVVVFRDESGFTLHPRLGRGWAKRGAQLRVPTASVHRARLSLSGWVAPQLGDEA